MSATDRTSDPTPPPKPRAPGASAPAGKPQRPDARFASTVKLMTPPPVGPGRFLALHNPCFLASAAVMLVSCLCISQADATTAAGLVDLLRLAGTVAAYELALVVMAVALMVVVGSRRDGRQLLALAALFAVDPTFTYHRCMVIDPSWGSLVPLAAVALAGAKLAVAGRLLGLTIDGRAIAATVALASVVQAAAAIPLFAGGAESGATHRAFVAGWLCAAALPALHLLVMRLAASSPAIRVASVRWAMHASPSLHALPYVAVLAHLLAAHFIAGAPFHVAYIAPGLLVAAVTVGAALRRSQPEASAAIGWWLPLVAIALCLLSGNAVDAMPLWHPSLTLFRVVMLMAAAAFGCAFAWHARKRSLGLAMACLIAILGRGPATLADRLAYGLPGDLAQWAAVGIIAAFALLALGGWISVKRKRQQSRVAAIG